MSNIENKLTTEKYFEKIFLNKPIKWDEIYLLPRKDTYNTYLRSFHYKILNSILYLNVKVYTSKLADSPLCSFSKHEDETTLHIFYSCNSTRRLWSQFKLFLEPNLLLPYLLPQTAIFDFPGEPDNQNFVLLSYLLLLYKR